jgi:hypothetical protein
VFTQWTGYNQGMTTKIPLSALRTGDAAPFIARLQAGSLEPVEVTSNGQPIFFMVSVPYLHAIALPESDSALALRLRQMQQTLGYAADRLDALAGELALKREPTAATTPVREPGRPRGKGGPKTRPDLWDMRVCANYPDKGCPSTDGRMFTTRVEDRHLCRACEKAAQRSA